MDLPGTDGLGSELEPVQDQVRGGPEQRLVLVTGRFTLGAVADDDRDALLAGDGGELAVSGERRPTAPGQSGGLDGVDKHSRAAPVEHRAVHLQVGLEVHRLLGGQHSG